MKGWRRHHQRTLEQAAREEAELYRRMKERRYFSRETERSSRVTAAERRVLQRHLEI